MNDRSRYVGCHHGSLLVLVATIAVLTVSTVACSRGGRAGGAGGGLAVEIVPGSPECYKTAGATTCPKDPSDPSGLPKTGAACALPVCKTCGSDTVPAYRDATGAPQVGWCICVETSGGTGSIYTCGRQGWGAK